MSVFVPAPRVCRFTLGFHALTGDKEWSVVLECGKVSEWPDGGGAMADTANAIEAWAAGVVMPLLAAGVIFDSITGQRMLAYAEPIYDFSESPEEGAIEEKCTPLNACLELKKQTGATGRSRRGFTFFSGLPSVTAFDDTGEPNQLDSTYVASWTSAGGSLLSGIAAVDNGSQLAVVSRFHKVEGIPSVPREEAVFAYVTTYSCTRTRVATRRKRAAV